MARPSRPRRRDVFINCAFDDDFREFLYALVFVVHDCGFRARTALEEQNFGEIRFEKIVRLIRNCGYGIHDISCTSLDPTNHLPRFNMPLELGLFLGACRFGGRGHSAKRCIVLDSERHRYQMFCSDVAGQDVIAHGDDVNRLIRVVRNWLNRLDRSNRMPGPKVIQDRFTEFRSELPLFCETLGHDLDDLDFNDYTTMVVRWIKANAW